MSKCPQCGVETNGTSFGNYYFSECEKCADSKIEVIQSEYQNRYSTARPALLEKEGALE